MPAIKAREQADGSTPYTAVVRIRRQSKVLQQEAKTFAYRSAAERRGKQREVALEDPAALVRALVSLEKHPVSNDFSWIGVVLRAAKSVKGLP